MCFLSMSFLSRDCVVFVTQLKIRPDVVKSVTCSTMKTQQIITTQLNHVLACVVVTKRSVRLDVCVKRHCYDKINVMMMIVSPVVVHVDSIYDFSLAEVQRVQVPSCSICFAADLCVRVVVQVKLESA